MQQSFSEMIEVYNVEFADSAGFMLYGSNPANKDCQALKQIEIQDGYWLCRYDKLNMVWSFSHYIFEDEAIDSSNEWHIYLPRVQVGSAL